MSLECIFCKSNVISMISRGVPRIPLRKLQLAPSPYPGTFIQNVPKRNYGAKPDPFSDYKVDATVQEDLARENIRLASHPGTLRIGVHDLPLDLNMSINRVLMKFSSRNLRRDSEKLWNLLQSRKPQIKGSALRAKVTRLERELLAGNPYYEKGARSRISEEEIIALRKNAADEVLPVLREQVHHWKPIDYTDYVCVQYLVRRFVEDYGVVSKILAEIQRRVAAFAPTSLFDFGSGVGSATFAAKAVFGSSIEEYYCVDTSPEMLATAREIVNNGENGAKPLLEKAYFRQFLPASHDREFDLVMSAYTLLELPTMNDRLKALRTLWKKTKRFLILVELGNATGYELIMEARDHLLGLDRIGKKPRKNEDLDRILAPGRVFAPCPHKLSCPRMSVAESRHAVCHFPISFQPLPYLGMRFAPKTTSDYSYLVLEKLEAKDDSGKEPERNVATNVVWPRVVEEVMTKRTHAICRICCIDGKLREMKVDRNRQKQLFNIVTHTKWGERLPIDLKVQVREGQVFSGHEVPSSVSLETQKASPDVRDHNSSANLSSLADDENEKRE